MSSNQPARRSRDPRRRSRADATPDDGRHAAHQDRRAGATDTHAEAGGRLKPPELGLLESSHGREILGGSPSRPALVEALVVALKRLRRVSWQLPGGTEMAVALEQDDIEQLRESGVLHLLAHLAERWPPGSRMRRYSASRIANPLSSRRTLLRRPSGTEPDRFPTG